VTDATNWTPDLPPPIETTEPTQGRPMTPSDVERFYCVCPRDDTGNRIQARDCVIHPPPPVTREASDGCALLSSNGAS
jgi:hypothetical protein